MNPDQFWYEDIDVFNAYLKAYRNKVNYTSWLNGVYIYKALESALINVIPNSIGIAFSESKDRPFVPYLDKPIDFSNFHHYEEEKNQKIEEVSEEGFKNALMRLNSLV